MKLKLPRLLTLNIAGKVQIQLNMIFCIMEKSDALSAQHLALFSETLLGSKTQLLRFA